MRNTNMVEDISLTEWFDEVFSTPSMFGWNSNSTKPLATNLTEAFRYAYEHGEKIETPYFVKYVCKVSAGELIDLIKISSHINEKTEKPDPIRYDLVAGKSTSKCNAQYNFCDKDGVDHIVENFVISIDEKKEKRNPGSGGYLMIQIRKDLPKTKFINVETNIPNEKSEESEE